MTSESFPRRHPDAVFREVDDEGLVVLSDLAEVKVLNPVGIKIFSMLDGKHSTEAIVRAVREEFEVSEEEAMKDLHDFLAELEANGMLVEAGT